MSARTLSALILALGTASAAHATTITQWTFNSTTPDGSTGTGSTAAAIGSGSLTLLGGVTNPGFNSGAGSSDTAASDNSGLQTSNYALQGAGDKTTGLQFSASSVGYQDVVFSFDLRFSNTSSKYALVQYSLDGLTYIDANVFTASGGDTWMNQLTVDLSNVAGADNNANLSFRVLSTFAPGTTSYVPASATKIYGTNGTWRFDTVTVSGSAMTAAVPEPSSYALAFAGLAVVGTVARRRRQVR